jgi:DNA-directed RNA polymerase subunit RPC12/RpoP
LICVRPWISVSKERKDTLNTVQYKCPNCGGELTYKPEKQQFGCDYCNSLFTEEEIAARYEKSNQQAERDADPTAQTLHDENDTSDFEEHTRLYACPSCGAQIIAEETSAATFCYYCHNPVILAGRLSGVMRPSFVIPFSISRPQAEESFRQWCKKRWFLPSGFKSRQQLEKMSGIYVPFWLTSCTADARLQCTGEKVRHWREGKFDVTEYKTFHIERSGSFPFARVPADGSKKIDDALMDAIEPFNYKEMRPFSMQYLSGFLADKYDVAWEDVVSRAQQRIQTGCRQKLRETISGYTTTSHEQMQMQFSNMQKEYALLPVWFMNYRYKGKQYSFALNAQTGKLSGTPPLSIPKLLGFCIGLLIVLVILGTGIGGAILS